jgi:broad specificity phosphatase PhoE
MDVKHARERINKVLDEAISPDTGNVLIVSHGALMIYMGKELLNRGFRGPKLKYPANGELHVYESADI